MLSTWHDAVLVAWFCVAPQAHATSTTHNTTTARTHRELFSVFYRDLLHASLEDALALDAQPPAAVAMFASMMRDIDTAGGRTDCIDQVRALLVAGVLCPLSMLHVHWWRRAMTLVLTVCVFVNGASR